MVRQIEVEIDDGLITECVRSKAVINLDGLPLHHDKRRPSRTRGRPEFSRQPEREREKGKERRRWIDG